MSETFEQFVARVNANGFLSADVGASIMAQKVKLSKGKEFHFKERAVGGVQKYPWDEWFDGNLWLIQRSDGPENEKGTIEAPTETRDFGVSVNAMVPKLHTAARRRYKVVQISREDADGNRIKDPPGLIIRARDMSDEERMAEDVLRAEEREASKAKRAEATANGQQPEPEEEDDTAPVGETVSV